RYTIDGSNPTATSGTVYNGAFNITSNCTVKAAYISSTNKVGIIGSQSTSKVDTAAPGASLAAGEITTTSIAVTATGSDTQSGVKSYTFQISTTSATEGFTTKETTDSTSGTATYTFTNLTQYTTYYLRVIVTDNAGRQTTSTVASAKTYHETTYCAGGSGTCSTCNGTGSTICRYFYSYANDPGRNRTKLPILWSCGDMRLHLAMFPYWLCL
ncbi:MAG: chitobiase/beta-hexosaminidase C-terminal domain-containing protein, partial [Clostridia bacterium]|nr:chitobiase/beta-hexosaminidase C-terminal domain-containing protein [Clostridia bacterium]